MNQNLKTAIKALLAVAIVMAALEYSKAIRASTNDIAIAAALAGWHLAKQGNTLAQSEAIIKNRLNECNESCPLFHVEQFRKR